MGDTSQKSKRPTKRKVLMLTQCQISWGELSHGLTELQEDVIADNIESLDVEIINRIQTTFCVLGVVVGSDFMNITKLMQIWSKPKQNWGRPEANRRSKSKLHLQCDLFHTSRAVEALNQVCFYVQISICRGESCVLLVCF